MYVLAFFFFQYFKNDHVLGNNINELLILQ